MEVEERDGFAHLLDCSRAPIGYLNARVDIGDGRQVNTVIVDEQRASLVRLAFELYATDTYSIEALQEAMEDHGLRARPAGRWKAERPLSVDTLHRVLTDPYYAGYTSYEGELFTGRHTALIDHDLFERVQEVYERRSGKGNRDRVLEHYLRGQLRCHRCHTERQRETRLIYTEATGRGGERYAYYLCRGRQMKDCDLTYLPVELVEQKIGDIYRGLALTKKFTDEFQTVLDDSVANFGSTTREMRRSLNRELTKLDERERSLVDAGMDATLDRATVRQKMNEIRQRRDSIALRIAEVDTELTTGVRILGSAAHLATNIGTLYEQTTDDIRHQLNYVFFKALYLDDHAGEDEAIVNDPFLTILDLHKEWLRVEGSTTRHGSTATTRTGQKAPP